MWTSQGLNLGPPDYESVCLPGGEGFEGVEGGQDFMNPRWVEVPERARRPSWTRAFSSVEAWRRVRWVRRM